MAWMAGASSASAAEPLSSCENRSASAHAAEGCGPAPPRQQLCPGSVFGTARPRDAGRREPQRWDRSAEQPLGAAAQASGPPARALGAFWVSLQPPIPSCSAEHPQRPELLLFIPRTPPAPRCCPTPPCLPRALPPPCTLTLGTLLGTPKMSTHFRPSPTRGRSMASSLLTPYLRREKGGGCWRPEPLRGA